MGSANLSVVVARLEAQIVDVHIIVKVLDAQTLFDPATECVLEIDESAVADIDTVQVRPKHLTIHF